MVEEGEGGSEGLKAGPKPTCRDGPPAAEICSAICPKFKAGPAAQNNSPNLGHSLKGNLSVSPTRSPRWAESTAEPICRLLLQVAKAGPVPEGLWAKGVNGGFGRQRSVLEWEGDAGMTTSEQGADGGLIAGAERESGGTGSFLRSEGTD